MLDVARAAEPDAVAGARAELLRKAQGASAIAFDAGTDIAAPTSANILSRDATPTSMSDAAKKFEAMVLQTFISSMMPKNAEGTYGQGMAGDMWKSMMAEKLADTVAEGGGIGIADRLLKDFEMRDGQKVAVSGTTSQSQRVEGDKPAMVATAFVDLIQRQLAKEIGVQAGPDSGGLFEN